MGIILLQEYGLRVHTSIMEVKLFRYCSLYFLSTLFIFIILYRLASVGSRIGRLRGTSGGFCPCGFFIVVRLRLVFAVGNKSLVTLVAAASSGRSMFVVVSSSWHINKFNGE